ncbi:MAG: FG-GAP-like repeat-containing protein [Myxococcota bacterium]|nr:FG-GAP-like repeat-containing protein [Myxococcota bacterium]
MKRPSLRLLLLVLLAALAGALAALLASRVDRPERATPSAPTSVSSPTQPPPRSTEGAALVQDGLPETLALSAGFGLRPEPAALLRELRQDVQRRPGRPRPLQRLASFLFEQDEPAAARQVLEPLLRLDPDDEAGLGLLGVIELRLGHLDLAERTFRRLVARMPEAWNGHHHLGLVLARQRRFAEAEASYQRALAADGQAFWPRVGLGLALLRQHRPAEALPQLDRAAALAPADPSIQLYRMHALEALGRLSEADEAHARYRREHTRGTVDLPFATRPPPAPASLAEAGGLRFTDVAPLLGLDFAGRGRAAAIADLDEDGLPDLLVGFLEEISRLHLARDSGLKYQEATAGSGLEFFDSAYGLAAADVDDDGDTDLFVARGGFQTGRLGRDADLLFLNEGQGRFVDATATAGLGDPAAGFAGVFADFDRDGRLDLFVVNHGAPCQLYRGLGQGRFAPLGEGHGIAGAGPAISAVAADFDDDGDPDLFVALNGEPNLLYRNDTPPPGAPGRADPTGGLRFQEVGFAARVALSGGFGSTVADFDRDGRLDLFVANLNNWNGGDQFSPGDPSYLFLNRGDLRFEEVATAAGLGYVGGASAPVAADLDGDGWVDLYLGTGGPEPRRDEPDLLYRNLGPATPGGPPRFVEVGRAAGVHRASLSGRGATCGDLDRDGDLDLFVPSGTHLASILGHSVLWRNDTPQGHRLQLRLVGTRSNRSALGARLVARIGERVLVEEVLGNTGFGGTRSLELHLGLGEHAALDELTVRWPSGETTRIAAPLLDRPVRLVEGESRLTEAR